MTNLTSDELKWLREVKDGGMMRKKLPEDMERRLLDITSKGRQALGGK